jgi:hypothetical protein
MLYLLYLTYRYRKQVPRKPRKVCDGIEICAKAVQNRFPSSHISIVIAEDIRNRFPHRFEELCSLFDFILVKTIGYHLNEHQEASAA